MDSAHSYAFAIAEIPVALRAAFIEEFQGILDRQLSVVRLGAPGVKKPPQKLLPRVVALCFKGRRCHLSQVPGTLQRAASLSQLAQEAVDFPNLMQWRYRALPGPPADRDSFLFSQGADLRHIAVRARQHSHPRPVGNSQLPQTPEFRHHRAGLTERI